MYIDALAAVIVSSETKRVAESSHLGDKAVDPTAVRRFRTTLVGLAGYIIQDKDE